MSKLSPDTLAYLNATHDKIEPKLAVGFSPAIIAFGGFDINIDYFPKPQLSVGLHYLIWKSEDIYGLEDKSCVISGVKPHFRYYFNARNHFFYTGMGFIMRDIKCDYRYRSPPWETSAYGKNSKRSYNLSQMSVEFGHRWIWSHVFIDLGAELMPFYPYRVDSEYEDARDKALNNFFPMLLITFRVGVASSN